MEMDNDLLYLKNSSSTQSCGSDDIQSHITATGFVISMRISAAN